MTTSVVETRPASLDDSYHFVVGPNQETERPRPTIASPSGLEVDMRTSPAKPARPDKTEESSAPPHPIPFMQDAFAESLFEATFGGKIPKPKLRAGDAKTRRAELLDQEKLDPPLAALWRYRPGQVNHELRRLMAQISFGVYLLLNGMANSQALVVSILQGHIDEVDEFLETTLEDIGLATKDLQDRIAHLKLPMDNMSVFETMLEDQKFRHQIIDGNLKIDHIVGRTQMALQQTVQDLAEGVSSTREFSIYLAEQEDGQWRRDRPDVIDIYNAMKGNTDGWFNAFIDLQAQASTLNGLVVRLNGMVAEMDRTAAAVNQRVMAAAAPTPEPPAPPAASSPRQTPRHTPRGSDASSVVQHESPVSKIPSAPPRLSLRLSSIVTMQSTGVSSFFDIPTGRGSLMVLRAHEAVAESGLHTQLEEIDESDLDEDDEDLGGAQLEDERVATPPSGEDVVVQVTEVAGEGEELLVPQSPPARNPRRLSERPPMLQQIVIDEAETAEAKEVPGEKEADAKEEPEPNLGLYILQPRTYTPIPPSPLPSPRVFDRSPLPSPRVFDTSPLPSPRVFDRSPRPMDDRPASKAAEPRKLRESTLSIAVSVAKDQRREPMTPLSPRSPTFDQAQLRRQPSKARLVSIGARATVRKPVPPKVEAMRREVEIPLPEMAPPVSKMMEPPVRRSQASPVNMLEEFPVPKMEPPARRREPSPVSMLDDFPVPRMEPPLHRSQASPVSMLDDFPVPRMDPPPLPRTKPPPLPAMSPLPSPRPSRRLPSSPPPPRNPTSSPASAPPSASASPSRPPPPSRSTSRPPTPPSFTARSTPRPPASTKPKPRTRPTARTSSARPRSPTSPSPRRDAPCSSPLRTRTCSSSAPCKPRRTRRSSSGRTRRGTPRARPVSPRRGTSPRPWA
ncbi:hypothetical protein B0T18DRAFT_23686 [Schizothecium vesticola]|uniref:Uncharacterized protein n=1 Tax=Schizothecium vesticola TaxID=314040 RepID=A0AA40FA12_9PEZI|nr:hypothetical protein B0T18DRAFT_23686 [Schizothecium vesticola]